MKAAERETSDRIGTSTARSISLVISIALNLLIAGLCCGQASPPQITPTIGIQHQAVFAGGGISFTVTASGTAPLLYQWRLAGQDLPGQTNRTLQINSAGPANEGDYTVVVSNAFGTVTNNPPARLYVVTTNQYIRANFTNDAGLRLPYFYKLPTDYDPLRQYPLVCSFHGTPGDENTFPATFLTIAPTHVFFSFDQQAKDPAIVVWPSRRAGDNSWTDAYLQQVSDFLPELLSKFSIDTNRVYIVGGSEGVHAAWDLAGLRPGFFAAALMRAGWQGHTPVAALGHLPVWAACARDDDAGQLGNTQNLVRSLRRAGRNVIYTEYASGGHAGALQQSLRTPAIIDWLLAQNRNGSAAGEPLCAITNPREEPTRTTATATLDLSGSAAAAGQPVTGVAWENTANAGKGTAFGSNTWSATGIPLSADRTNIIIVTATTISWAPGFGGNTTFNDTLSVFNSPIRTALVLQERGVSLSWNGGVPPFQVQKATDLNGGNWQNILTNAVSPVVLPVEGKLGLFRVLGQ